MPDKFEQFRATLRASLKDIRPGPEYKSVRKVFDKEMKDLLRKGIVSFGDQHKLRGFELECYIHSIFNEMGFDVEEEKQGFHDGIVCPLDRFEPQKPIVLEIKSGKAQSPTREDLRQLDDWVFELSDEEKARKEGLGGGGDGLALATAGVFTSKQHHPTPHKGVMIYNGPIGQAFKDRADNWLGANEREFATKRDFCIISFACLVSWYEAYEKDKSLSGKLWEKIHSTCGILEAPYSS